MTSYLPDRMPAGKLDRETPRVAARIDGGRGFLFVNNYQKDHPLPEQKEFQVESRSPRGPSRYPANR